MKKTYLQTQQLKKKLQYSSYVFNFFKIPTFRKYIPVLIENEIQHIKDFFDIEIEKSKEENEEILKEESLVKKFTENNKELIDDIKIIFSDVNKNFVTLEKNNFRKIILLNYIFLSRKKLFEEIVKYVKTDLNFYILYDILYMFDRNYNKFNVEHLYTCKCEKFNSKRDDYLVNNSIYKYLNIFKENFDEYKKGTKTFNRLISIFYKLSLVYSDDNSLYIYLPIYFLRNIFGQVIKENFKGCFYSIFYKFLIDFEKSDKSNFLNSKYNSIYTENIKKIHLYKLKNHLLQFYNENKENVINEILFESDEKRMKKWLTNNVTFGIMYNVKLKNGVIDFFTSQKDYIIDVKDDVISFYNFMNEEINRVLIEDLIINNNNTMGYINNNDEMITLTNNCINKLRNIVKDDRIIKHIEKIEDFNYRYNLVIGDISFYLKYFKIILSGYKRDQQCNVDLFKEDTFDTVEQRSIFFNIPVLIKKSEEYFIFDDSISFEDLIKSNDESDKEMLQEMCKFIMKGSKCVDKNN